MQIVCMFFLELKWNTKQGTVKERIHLFLFIKYVKKNLLKGKYWTCMKKGVEENIVRILIKIF